MVCVQQQGISREGWSMKGNCFQSGWTICGAKYAMWKEVSFYWHGYFNYQQWESKDWNVGIYQGSDWNVWWGCIDEIKICGVWKIDYDLGNCTPEWIRIRYVSFNCG